jgi:hypothetical protein
MLNINTIAIFFICQYFKKGTPPDYAAMKALFTSNSTLYNFQSNSLTFYDIDKFITGFKASINSGNLIAFEEIELRG